MTSPDSQVNGTPPVTGTTPVTDTTGGVTSTGPEARVSAPSEPAVPGRTGRTSRVAGLDGVAVVVSRGGGWTPTRRDEIVVWRDGRVLRSAAEQPWGYDELRLRPAAVERLLASARSHRLDAERDVGEPLITDQESLQVLLPVAGQGTAAATSVYAPDERDGLTPSQVAARAEVLEFAAELAALRDPAPDDVADAAHAFVPTELRLHAAPVLPVEPGSGVSDASVATQRWPLARAVVDVFKSRCVEVGGADASAILAALGDARAGGADGATGARMVVASGVAIPERLELRIVAVVAHHEPCFAPDVAPAEVPWPADTRTGATTIDVLAAEVVTHRLAFADRLGRQAHSGADLTWYEYGYSAVIVAGRRLVDVSGRSTFSSREPDGFAFRFDPVSGEVLELTAE